MKLRIATPQGLIVSEESIDKLTLPTVNGPITVLQDHVPLITLLDAGEVQIHIGDSVQELAVSKGIIEIKVVDDVTIINVMADTAERAEDIDIEKAEEARKKAVEYMEKQEELAEQDFTMLQAKIEKELSRINVGKKYKNAR